MKLLKALFGNYSEKEIKRMKPLQEAVLALEEEYRALTDEELRAKTASFRERYEGGESLDSLLPEAFATCREAGDRVLNMRHFPVQILGGIALHQGRISEMHTGEGKTLTAALAAVVAGWRGKGCHVVTSNDYLAARDAETMMDFYTACFLLCSSVTQDNTPQERKAAYLSDITYLTSKEVTADFLRDQMALGTLNTHTRVLARMVSGESVPSVVQRGLACAIIDEADSVLCDGGSTPLIISVPKDNAPNAEQYLTALSVAKTMKIGRHYTVNKKF